MYSNASIIANASATHKMDKFAPKGGASGNVPEASSAPVTAKKAKITKATHTTLRSLESGTAPRGKGKTHQ